jgi:ubiquinone biosynthesis monooxygenase Coq7
MTLPFLPQPPSLDAIISVADKALRSVFAPARAARPSPATGPAPELTDAEKRKSGALMRVNHTGEVAAQALYHGQAFVARTEKTREMLLHAAREETDHLAWCEARLSELQSGTSILNPLWYAGSFAIGALAATFGDRVSLGFVSETNGRWKATSTSIWNGFHPGICAVARSSKPCGQMKFRMARPPGRPAAPNYRRRRGHS